MITGYRQRSVALLALAAALGLAGCQHLGIGTTAIGEIVGNPAAYEGREVSVKGRVSDVRKIPLVDFKSYVIADGSGQIRVSTRYDLPAEGAKLVVRGKVTNMAIVGGHTVGLRIVESERSGTI